MNGDLRYFWLGTGVGLAAAIMLTPKSGRETRSYLNSKAADGADYVKARAEEARTAAVDVVERGKQAVKKQADAAAAALEEGKQAYRARVSQS
jgi:gas vesicle protein